MTDLRSPPRPHLNTMLAHAPQSLLAPWPPAVQSSSAPPCSCSPRTALLLWACPAHLTASPGRGDVGFHLASGFCLQIPGGVTPSLSVWRTREMSPIQHTPGRRACRLRGTQGVHMGRSPSSLKDPGSPRGGPCLPSSVPARGRRHKGAGCTPLQDASRPRSMELSTSMGNM